MRETVLFVTDQAFLQTARVGGAQRCTAEYLELLRRTGLDVVEHTVELDLSFVEKAKIKAGLDAYGSYAGEASGVIDRIDSTGASVVALNQVDLIPLVPALRASRPRVRVVVLSHGNESGDYLHEVVRGSNSDLTRSVGIHRLGNLLYKEAEAYAEVDAVLCLSETERHINLWLGAKEAVVVPRTWSPNFLDWDPISKRVGFVGTLNHPPNFEGLRRLLEAMVAAQIDDVEVRVVGSGNGEARVLAGLYSGVVPLGALSDEELLEEAESWSLFANPIWWYARGASTKLAQAISWGIPITTSVPGMRGYEWGLGELLVAESPDRMAEQVAEVTASPEVRSALATSVREVACSGPEIDALAQKVRPVLLGSEGERLTGALR